MPFEDRTLSCSDCQASFVFTAGEQKFYQEKGYSTPPKRCEDCRLKRKAENKSGSRSQRSGSGSGPRGREERPRHPATCSRCGASFDAPFVPKPDRPVFCRDCFNTARTR